MKYKLYTVLKIDEVNSLGAVKIRIRSLKAAMEEREKNDIKHEKSQKSFERVVFSKEMKKEYTILIPQMSPIHFQFMKTALGGSKYKTIMLPEVDSNAVEEGLRYINNDACYPTIVSLGQIISFLKNSDLDLNKTAPLSAKRRPTRPGHGAFSPCGQKSPAGAAARNCNRW